MNTCPTCGYDMAKGAAHLCIPESPPPATPLIALERCEKCKLPSLRGQMACDVPDCPMKPEAAPSFQNVATWMKPAAPQESRVYRAGEQFGPPYSAPSVCLGCGASMQWHKCVCKPAQPESAAVREFLVQPFNPLIDGDTGLCIPFPIQNNALMYLNIHVIEKSAYDRLAGELREVKAERKQAMAASSEWSRRANELREQLSLVTRERDELQQNEHKMNAALSAKQEQLEGVSAEKNEWSARTEAWMKAHAVARAEVERQRKRADDNAWRMTVLEAERDEKTKGKT